MTGFRKARALATLGAGALLATLALAGPASAHTGSHDGKHDDDPAGTIASYDGESGKLVIDLAKGGSISGVVTGRTWIDDGDHGCDDDDGETSRKAKAARKGAQARTGDGDWGCHERRSGDHDRDGHRGGKRGWRHGWDKGDESDLVEGAVVEDAILVLEDGKAWYAKVELDD